MAGQRIGYVRHRAAIARLGLHRCDRKAGVRCVGANGRSDGAESVVELEREEHVSDGDVVLERHRVAPRVAFRVAY